MGSPGRPGSSHAQQAFAGRRGQRPVLPATAADPHCRRSAGPGRPPQAQAGRQGPLSSPLPLSLQWLKDPGHCRERWTLCGQTLGILLSWPLAATLAWLCLLGAQGHLRLLGWLLAVAVIALTIALFTLYVLRTGEWLSARQQALVGSGS